MMKNKRQENILDIIERNDVETQEELARLLKDRGMTVTQATVSRDIKELRLIKVLSDKGVYKYAPIEKSDSRNLSVMMRIFADSVISIEASGNMVIIKTLSGSANAAAEAVDSLKWTEIAGTIAGDNTIFMVVREGTDTGEVMKKLKRLAN